MGCMESSQDSSGTSARDRGLATSGGTRTYGSYSRLQSTASTSTGYPAQSTSGSGRYTQGDGTSAGGARTGKRPSASLTPDRPSDGVATTNQSGSPDPFEDPMGFCPQKYWVKDEEAPTCGYCGEEFTLTNRRHHCRLCGDIFHAGKCAQKAGSLEVWVCYYCHSYHTVHKEKLQNGTVLTKYTRNLDRDHQRHFWLSSDGRELIWKEVESRSRLSGLTGPTVHNLRLADVTRVQPSGPPGLQSYNHLYSFQIITGERPYVLEAGNVADHGTWTEGLKCAVYVCQARDNLQGRKLEDRAKRHAKRSRDSHRQLVVERLQSRQRLRTS